jgi:hypothetical protein
MNVLFPFLSDHPDAANQLSRTDKTVPFDAVVDLVARRQDFPFNLNPDVAARLRDEEPLGPLLMYGYLRVIEGPRWRALVAGARPDEPSQGVDWVTFVRPPGFHQGIALPDDDEVTQRVSVFTDVGGSVRRVSIDYSQPGPPDWSQPGPRGLSMSLTTECSLPDWGECQSSECGGQCELRRKPDHDDGLVCWCPNP